ncbi:MAG: 50S ribosomal protein L24e [Thermoprotei archaeon]|nr:MAG: 50S ribosomal protein L24e [Thermoprotei archaeon]RLE90281.1 MAG: 50S ribosomal protein L24e [Thermoprotei archaeon]
MPKLRECSFCGYKIPPGTGLLFVKNDGTLLYFCSRKCRISYMRKRNPIKLKWTRKYRKAKSKK